MFKLNEFKSFIFKGNILDLAIGIIIGGAFGKIVNSLISDVIMPPLGLIINNVDFKELKANISPIADHPVTINYGMFIQTVFEFLVIGFAVFMLAQAAARILKKQEAAEAAAAAQAAAQAPKVATQEELLAEIRDLLKAQQK